MYDEITLTFTRKMTEEELSNLIFKANGLLSNMSWSKPTLGTVLRHALMHSWNRHISNIEDDTPGIPVMPSAVPTSADDPCDSDLIVDYMAYRLSLVGRDLPEVLGEDDMSWWDSQSPEPRWLDVRRAIKSSPVYVQLLDRAIDHQLKYLASSAPSWKEREASVKWFTLSIEYNASSPTSAAAYCKAHRRDFPRGLSVSSTTGADGTCTIYAKCRGAGELEIAREMFFELGWDVNHQTTEEQGATRAQPPR